MTEFAAHDRLSEYLDGELSGDELARMEEALAADPALRAELEELRALVDRLGSLPPVKAPEGLVASVMEATADLAIGVQSGDLPVAANVVFWKTPWFGAVAAMLLVGVGVVFVNQGGETMAPPSPAMMAASEEPAASTIPSPSGSLRGEDLDAGDAVVDAGFAADAEEAARERLADRLAAEGGSGAEGRPLMEEATPRVMNGVTGPAEAPAASPPPASRPARDVRRESAVGPDGVFEAEWESDDGVVMHELDPSPAPEEPTAGAFAPEPEDEPAVASADDVTMSDEPLEDYLDPAADLEVAEAESAPVASGGAVRREGGGRVAARTAPPKLDEVTFTGVGGDATLKLAPGVTRDQVISALRSAGITVTPMASGKLRLDLAESNASTMSRVLREHGSLKMGRAPEANADARIRVDVSVTAE